MKREKELFLDEISSQVAEKPTFVITQYKKLTANQANKFRREVSKFGANFEVVKKRMLVKASEKIGVTIDEKTLDGHIGVLFTGEDPVEATKAIIDFSKDNDDCFDLVGARVEGALISKEDVHALSKIPPKDQLRAQFLGLLEAPMAETLGVMDALLSSVVYCVDNKINKAEGE